MSVAAIGHLMRAGHRRALPRTCRPAQDETTGSYLLRLGISNRITGADIVDYLTAGTSQSIDKVSLAALATASGQPSLTLAYALPQLRPQHPDHPDYPDPDHPAMALQGRTVPAKPNTVRPACRRCTATRTTAERIDIWYRHEHNICVRHQLWIGPGQLPRGHHPYPVADCPHWRPFAISASTADHDRFRVEFQRRLPPAHRDLADTDLQLLATVRGSAAIHWHQPPAETNQ